MRSEERQQGATRERLLEVASGLFAEKGYRGTTVAEICRLAKANIAAVNYHFGGKEKLYAEAWRYAHDMLVKRIPPDGGVPAAAPPEERLRGRIRNVLQTALCKDAVAFRIMRHEMANPTGLLRQVIDDTIEPLREATQATIRELLGEGVDAQVVALCEVSTMGPCIGIVHQRQAEEHRGLAPIFTEDMLDEMVEHFAAFALAGIREIRCRMQGRAVAGTAPDSRRETGSQP